MEALACSSLITCSMTAAIAAASTAPTPPVMRVVDPVPLDSLIPMFDQFNQSAVTAFRVDERDLRPSPANPGSLIHQSGTLGRQVFQGGNDVNHRIGNVMQSLSVCRQELADRCIGTQRSQQLDERPTDGKHRLFDTLVFDGFSIEGLDPIPLAVVVNRRVEVVYHHGYVIKVQEFHAASVTGLGLLNPGADPTTSTSSSLVAPEVCMSVITGFARTPIGRFGGGFKPLQAIDLGAAAIAAALERSGVSGSQIDEVVMGHVLQAGAGQITARQAAVKAGIPMTVPSTTVNKVCLSGMTAIAMVDRSIRLGEASFAVAGGMESMTNAPYIDRTARWGARFGDTSLVDSMQHDGLWCAFDQCTMGESSDHKNASLGIDRTTQDEWSAESHRRAAAATDSGHFAKEIVPVSVPQRRGDPEVVSADEGIRPDVTAESLAGLGSAFTGDGTITAGNASQISDGGAAVVVASRTAAEAVDAPIAAEILAYGQIGGVDATLHERPAEAIKVALKRAELTTADLDVIEINEAFASVALWSAKMLDLDAADVNPNGGAVALGHPIGCTGARLVVSLINELQRRGGGIGAAALCGGGGQGDALIVKV